MTSPATITALCSGLAALVTAVTALVKVLTHQHPTAPGKEPPA